MLGPKLRFAFQEKHHHFNHRKITSFKIGPLLENTDQFEPFVNELVLKLFASDIKQVHMLGRWMVGSREVTYSHFVP